MADFSSLAQGKFTSTGSSKNIVLPSGATWMNVWNSTVSRNAQTTAIGVSYRWQFGMGAGEGLEHLKAGSGVAGANLDVYLTSGGFTFIDSSLNQSGIINATVTAVSTATTPVVSNSGTNGLVAGNVVRMFNVAGAKQLGGIDFTVGNGTLTSGTFSLDYMSQIAAGTTGSWMRIDFPSIFYPRVRFITKITAANPAVVSLSVTHGYVVGQVVRMVVPAAYGMTQMDGIQATILAVNTAVTAGSGNTITIDVDASAFTPFAFPATGVNAFTPAQTVPMAENTAVALAEGEDILSDSTVNTAFVGMNLGAGANGPAGQANDVIYWQAGSSFTVDNE